MDTPLRNVRTNIVQSIRAYGVKDLEAAVEQLGHHFMYANLAKAQRKQDVLDLIAAHPGRRAGDLAPMAGMELLDFKVRVRRLKDLGLTISLGTGYKISPRGHSLRAP